MTKNNEITLAEELKQELKIYVMEFEYLKKDGSVRRAKGTLNPEYFETSDNYSEIKGVRAADPNYITYWDVEKDGWRKFEADKLINIIYC